MKVLAGVLIAAAALTAMPFARPALAQKSRFDALLACERHAVLQFRRQNPAFRRFIIDRAHVDMDKFGDKVGSQFVSSIYHGKALYEAAAGPKTVRFLCLHAGIGRGPVFVYALSD